MTRISEWARQLGIRVAPFDAVSLPPHGATVYRVKDIFTTRDGSWDVSNKRGSIEQWARDAYLERRFDDAGADHHIFGRVLGDNSANIMYRTADGGTHANAGVKPHNEWGNIVMWSSSSFAPDRGERGTWLWWPDGEYVDIVSGAGLPANEHVSWFAVWEKTTYDGDTSTEPDRPDPVEPPSGFGEALVNIEGRLQRIERLLNSWQGD